MLITLIAMASMAFPPAEMVMSIAPMASMPARQTYNPDEIKVDVRKEIANRISEGFYVHQGAWTIADAVVRNAKRYGVPVDLILAVISNESAFRKGEMSPCGAKGLMQIMPETAEFIAKSIGVKSYDIWDIRTNIRFGTWYIKYLNQQFHNYSLVIKAYNCGAGTVNRIEFGKGGVYPRETRDYHTKVTETLVLIQASMPYLVAEL